METFDWLEKKMREKHTWMWYGSIRSMFRSWVKERIHIRQYTYGDTPSMIHWKTTAKQWILHVTTAEQERDVPVYIFLDINANWRSGIVTTYWQGVKQRLADYMLFAQEYRLQHTKILYGEDHILHTCPCAVVDDRLHMFNLVDSAVDATKDAYISSLSRFLSYCIHLPKRSVVCLISDFLCRDDVKDMYAVVQQMHAVHEVNLSIPLLVWTNFDYNTLLW